MVTVIVKAKLTYKVTVALKVKITVEVKVTGVTTRLVPRSRLRQRSV
jgi:hypothetical protein